MSAAQVRAYGTTRTAFSMTRCERRMEGLYPLQLRSMVGLIPIFAVEVLDRSVFDKLPGFTRRLNWFLKHRPQLAKLVSRWVEPGHGERHLLSLLRGHRLKRLLRRMLDEAEFLSEFGIRSLSKVHQAQPYSLEYGGIAA